MKESEMFRANKINEANRKKAEKQNTIDKLITKYKERIKNSKEEYTQVYTRFGYIVLTNEIINDLEELNK